MRLICMVLLLPMSLSCLSFSPLPEGGITPTGENIFSSCRGKTGRSRIICMRKLLHACQSAQNVLVRKTLTKTSRVGRTIVKRYRICVVGKNDGRSYRCFNDVRTVYSPSFWDRLKDYGAVSVISLILGLAAGIAL